MSRRHSDHACTRIRLQRGGNRQDGAARQRDDIIGPMEGKVRPRAQTSEGSDPGLQGPTLSAGVCRSLLPYTSCHVMLHIMCKRRPPRFLNRNHHELPAFAAQQQIPSCSATAPAPPRLACVQTRLEACPRPPPLTHAKGQSCLQAVPVQRLARRVPGGNQDPSHTP